MISNWIIDWYYYNMIKLIYNDIVCFKFNKRLEIDNIRLIFFIINIKQFYIKKS